MGVTVAWEDDERTILRLVFSNHWTLEELHTIGLEAILMIRTVDHPVYVISDFSESASVPIGVLWQARDLNRMRPPNWEAGITITHDALARNLLELFGLVYLGQRHKRLRIAGTNEEAHEIITGLKLENRVS